MVASARSWWRSSSAAGAGWSVGFFFAGMHDFTLSNQDTTLIYDGSFALEAIFTGAMFTVGINKKRGRAWGLLFAGALVLACQGFAQVEERYGKAGAETILSNASTHLVLPGVGQREAEFYSKRIGKTTITTSSRSRRGPWEVSSHRGEAARWLIEPNEIRTLSERQVLLLADVAAPLLVRVKPYYRSRHFARRTHLPLPWQPGRTTTQSPMKPLPPAPPSSGTGSLSPD